jgi:hypothetical protein
MGWGWEHYRPDVSARLDEHGGQKETRDQRLWDEFTAECNGAIAHIAKDPKYDDLDLFIDWDEV